MSTHYEFPTQKLKPLSSFISENATSPLPQPVVIALCGSFNPVHNAHIAIYNATKKLLESEKSKTEPQRSFVVLGGYLSLVGDAYPKEGLHPFKERLEIAEAAIAHHPDLMIDTWEGKQANYTRTLYVLEHLEDTVREYYAEKERDLLAKIVADGTQIRVVFACGADLFSSIFVPGVWPLKLLRVLLDRFIIVILRRMNTGKHKETILYVDSDEKLKEVAGRPLEENVDGHTLKMALDHYKFFFGAFDVPDNTSSTMIRELLASNKTAEEKKAEVAKMVAPEAVDLVIKYYH